MKGGICDGMGQPILHFDGTVNWVLDCLGQRQPLVSKVLAKAVGALCDASADLAAC